MVDVIKLVNFLHYILPLLGVFEEDVEPMIDIIIRALHLINEKIGLICAVLDIILLASLLIGLSS